MKKTTLALACSALLLGSAAFADSSGAGYGSTPGTHTKHGNSSSQHSQQKAQCQSQVKSQGLTGDAARKFMKSCMAKKPATGTQPKPEAQQPQAKAPSESM